MAGSPDPFFMRGFVRRLPSGQFVAVCLRPYLVAQADSLPEANEKMVALIQGYADDAAKDGRLEAALRRRAPVGLHAQYVVAAVFHKLSHSAPVSTFRLPLPQHA